MFEKSVKPLHDAGDVGKAQKRDVKLVKAGGHTVKDIHTLQEVFNQMTGLVAVTVQNALLLRLPLQEMKNCMPCAWAL